jgi:hypothetical protein
MVQRSVKYATTSEGWGAGVRLFGALCVSANLPERADKAFWELSKRATAGTAERYYVSIT